MAMVVDCASGSFPCVLPARATGLHARRLAWRRRQRWPGPGLCCPRRVNGPPWSCACRHTRWCPTVRRRSGCSASRVRGAVGDPLGRRVTLPWTTRRDGAARRLFPPLAHAPGKAVAWARVPATQQPLRRPSLAAITARTRTVLDTSSSRSTVWRMLETDAITPWPSKDWGFPRDPHVGDTAGPRLALAARKWHGEPLGRKNHIPSADEQRRIQARCRCYPSRPPAPARVASRAHAYERGGALHALAAWDVRRRAIRGRCALMTGIASLGRVVQQVLAEAPARAGARLGWIVDHGALPRGDASKQRLRQVDARLMLVQTPVHVRWLNPIEMSYAIIPGKRLRPHDGADWAAIRLRLAMDDALSPPNPTPLQWKCDRAQLRAWFGKIEARYRALIATQCPCCQEAAARGQHVCHGALR